jgi:hypothetical protein
MGKSLLSSGIALKAPPPNDQQKYSQANGLVWICADLIRFCVKLMEAFKPIRRPEADVQSGGELN